MTFLSTEPQDYGSIDYSCRGFGGIMFSSVPQPSTSSEKFPIVVQHNLAHFWERRGLIPKTAGFPMPLLETYRDAKEGVHNEMRKFTDDLPREWTLHRNLLAGELY